MFRYVILGLATLLLCAGALAGMVFAADYKMQDPFDAKRWQSAPVDRDNARARMSRDLAQRMVDQRWDFRRMEALLGKAEDDTATVGGYIRVNTYSGIAVYRLGPTWRLIDAGRQELRVAFDLHGQVFAVGINAVGSRDVTKLAYREPARSSRY